MYCYQRLPTHSLGLHSPNAESTVNAWRVRYAGSHNATPRPTEPKNYFEMPSGLTVSPLITQASLCMRRLPLETASWACSWSAKVTRLCIKSACCSRKTFHSTATSCLHSQFSHEANALLPLSSARCNYRSSLKTSIARRPLVVCVWNRSRRSKDSARCCHRRKGLAFVSEVHRDATGPSKLFATAAEFS